MSLLGFMIGLSMPIASAAFVIFLDCAWRNRGNKNFTSDDFDVAMEALDVITDGGRNVDLSGASMVFADLSGANLSGADLRVNR